MTDEVATSLRTPQGVRQSQLSGRDCFASLTMADEVATSLRTPQGVWQSQLSGRDCFASLTMTVWSENVIASTSVTGFYSEFVLGFQYCN